MSGIKPATQPVHILVADDDPDDCLLLREAFAEAGIGAERHFVANGEALLDYLYQRGDYMDSERYPAPSLILLDLNMPLMDGREALQHIKHHPLLRRIPLVILSTSSAAEDIADSYAGGVNSYITKPSSFSGLLSMVRQLSTYWLELVELPAPLKAGPLTGGKA